MADSEAFDDTVEEADCSVEISPAMAPCSACRLSLAFLAAKHGGHLKDGKLDVEGLKKANPILFGETNTGAAKGGAQHHGGPQPLTMDDQIRAAARRSG